MAIHVGLVVPLAGGTHGLLGRSKPVKVVGEGLGDEVVGAHVALVGCVTEPVVEAGWESDSDGDPLPSYTLGRPMFSH